MKRTPKKTKDDDDMKTAPTPTKYAEVQGPHFPFLREDWMENLLKCPGQKKAANYTYVKCATINEGDHAYVPYELTDEKTNEEFTGLYYAVCIKKTKSTARFHFQACSPLSGVKGEDKYGDIETKDKLYKIKQTETQPQQQPQQDNKQMNEKLDELSKNITNLNTTLSTKIASAQAQAAATNITAQQVAGQLLDLRTKTLPRVKATEPDDPKKPLTECTITNVKYEENENLKNIIINIAKSKDMTLNATDFDAFRAMKKGGVARQRDKPPLIIVAFRTNDMKTKFKKRHENEPKRDNPIYINENLTSDQRNLFYQARQLKTTHKYKYAWTRDGQVYLRKNDDSASIHIPSETKLTELQNKQN